MTNDKPKYIRARGIHEQYAIGLSTVHKWVANGKLPQPYAKLSPKCVVWLSEDVEQAFNLMKKNGDTNAVV